MDPTAPTTQKVKASTTTNQDSESRLGLLKQRLKIAKAFCKKPHETWKKHIEEYEISDISNTEEVRDRVRIGYLFRKIESDMPAIFDDQPDLFIKGRGKYRVYDDYFNNVYDWLWDIQLLEEKVEDTGVYFDLLGMGYIDSPWVTETEVVQDTEMQDQPVIDPTTGQPAIDPMSGMPQTQQVQVPVQYTVPVKDQPEAKVRDPFKTYFSPETKFDVHLAYSNCPYYINEDTMSKDEIKARFNKDVDPTEILHTNITEIDTELSNIKDKSEFKDDIKRATVYEYYGCLPEDMAKGIQSSKPWTYKTEYHIYFTNNEELQAEECKYPTKPLKVLGNYGLANKFFKFGDAKHLTPLIKELEQYRTQILRHTRKVANPKLLAPNTANIDSVALTDPNPGKIVGYTPDGSSSEPHYLQVGQLGSEVGTGVQLVRTDLEQTSGSFSLAQGSGQSTVRSPRGIETFSEAADKNVRRKRKKIARFIREIIKFQYELCGMNWDPSNQDVADIIYAGEEKPKVSTDDVVKVLGDSKILAKVDIEVESLSINKVQQKQEALDFFDVAVQHPDIFNVVECARDLVQNGFNKKDGDRYLVSMEQMKAQIIQQFIGEVGQVAPELGGQLAQVIQSPNMTAMQSQANNPVKESMNFKDLPPQGQAQMAAQAGIHLNPNQTNQPNQPPSNSRPVSQTRKPLPPLSQG